jgi:predicted nucleic acid-binding Zn ribbon protein
MEKLMSQTGFVLKGSGWYVTDFKGGSKPKPEGGKEAPKSEVSAAPETKKPESSPKS